jgi:hypothetical protein
MRQSPRQLIVAMHTAVISPADRVIAPRSSNIFFMNAGKKDGPEKPSPAGVEHDGVKPQAC